jgi:hypothetical protein
VGVELERQPVVQHADRVDDAADRRPRFVGEGLQRACDGRAIAQVDLDHVHRGAGGLQRADCGHALRNALVEVAGRPARARRQAVAAHQH